MKKPWMGVVVLLAGAWGLRAQEVRVTAANAQPDGTNVAATFADTSAARVNLVRDTSSAGVASAEPASSAAPAVPDPKPRLLFGDRDDYRWQLGIGVEYLRFRSNLFDASAVGVNTNLTYFTNDWFGFEGNVATAFAPTIYHNDHVKYLGYAGGIHVGSRRARWEPWAHVLVGGAHMLPQTANNGKNSLGVTAGGGVDWRLYARLSLRGEADYVYTRFFQQTQNNFQGFAGIVIHF
jgi:hypothetical protein